MKPDLVYFIKPIGLPGPIKIGCSCVPQDRLMTLAIWSPFPLELLATTPGSYTLEHRLHRRFAKDHTHGEWFREGPDLLAGIAALKSGSGVEDAFDFSKSQARFRKPMNRIFTPEDRVRMSALGRIRGARHRAARKFGHQVWDPKDIADIYYDHERKPITAEQLVRIADYIANAETQCVKEWPRAEAA